MKVQAKASWVWLKTLKFEDVCGKTQQRAKMAGESHHECCQSYGPRFCFLFRPLSEKGVDGACSVLIGNTPLLFLLTLLCRLDVERLRP